MPREIPKIASAFNIEVSKYLKAIDELEDLRFHIEKGYLRNLSLPRIEHYYELAFLRIFLAWEVFIEQSFYRYICGYTFHGLISVPKSCFLKDPSVAEISLLSGRSYILWHDPDVICSRVTKYLVNSNFESVILSFKAQLSSYSVIRHRIAHNQIDAIKKFNTVTLALAGRTYPTSSAGKYLRDFVPGKPFPKRWINEIADSLVSVSYQIAN